MSVVNKVLQILRHPLLRQRIGISQLTCRVSTTPCLNGIFEPDESEYTPEIPEYDTINLSLKGYDFVVVEAFARHCHRLAHTLDLEADSYPVPARTTKVQVFKPQSTIPSREYHVAMCERVVQLENVTSLQLPMYMQAVQMSQPQGVEITFQQQNEEDDEFLYIPDKDLISLHSQLDDMDEEKAAKKKKK